MSTYNTFFFAVFPYLAVGIFLIGSIVRYRRTKFKVSSLSSQFLEGRKLFWGSMPFHWGLMFLFFGHLIAFLIPRSVIFWNSDPLRLVILEVTALIFGITVLIGLVQLMVRRLGSDRLMAVTTKMDIFVQLILLAQFVTGIWTAVGYRWGSSWFASVLSPYLKSLFVLDPEIAAVSLMPLIVQLHIIGAFLIILMIPFTRLMHVLVFPLHYLWRPYQQVIWNWDRRSVRSPKTKWSLHEPRNN